LQDNVVPGQAKSTLFAAQVDLRASILVSWGAGRGAIGRGEIAATLPIGGFGRVVDIDIL